MPRLGNLEAAHRSIDSLSDPVLQNLAKAVLARAGVLALQDQRDTGRAHTVADAEFLVADRNVLEKLAAGASLDDAIGWGP